jgi:heme o synthase
VTVAALGLNVDSTLGAWLTLTKFRISAVSTLTAAMGYIASSRMVDVRLVSAVFGTLFMAMASSTLNEVAERDIDALMRRTRHRPIPSGHVSARAATLFALTLAASGAVLLYAAHGTLPAVLGLLAMVWYNCLYTPLKRVTAFAVVPGSVIGALPPAIGWAAAGGELGTPALLALCSVFFLWQVPHFWLLALRHHTDYEAAGLPTLFQHFSTRQIYRLVFTWTSASVAACALLWVFQAISGWIAASAIGLAGVWLVGRFAFMLEPRPDDQRAFRAFMDINRFALVVIGTVVFDALVG